MLTPAKPILALGAVFAATLAPPASAAAEPRTRLVECEAGNCLVVTGRRAHAAAVVRINGHAVPVQGSRKWRATVPVETVRQWSAPYARTITVSVVDAMTRSQASTEVDLPIGLFGRVESLAMLVISVK
jgi:hypothetical protein